MERTHSLEKEIKLLLNVNVLEIKQMQASVLKGAKSFVVFKLPLYKFKIYSVKSLIYIYLVLFSF